MQTTNPEDDEKKELEFIFKNIHSCDEVMHPSVWNPDWHQCPFCCSQFNTDGVMYHKTKKELTH